MTDDEIRKARELVEAATEGPWEASSFFAPNTPIPHAVFADRARPGYKVPAQTALIIDANFIAASRTLIPQLLDEVERLREYEWKYKELCE